MNKNKVGAATAPLGFLIMSKQQNGYLSQMSKSLNTS